MNQSKMYLFTALIMLMSYNLSGLKAQPKRGNVREWMIGFSYYGYSVLPQDQIFADADSPNKEGVIGFRFNTVNDNTARIAFLMDFELQIGGVDRNYYGHDAPSIAFGIQWFCGPRFKLNSNSLSLHTLAGFNRMSISGADSDIRYSRSVNIQYYGTDGISSNWANYYNRMGNRASSMFIPEMPSFSRTAFALNLGLDADLSSLIRLYLDYIPVFDDGLRSDFRFGIGFVFK